MDHVRRVGRVCVARNVTRFLKNINLTRVLSIPKTKVVVREEDRSLGTHLADGGPSGPSSVMSLLCAICPHATPLNVPLFISGCQRLANMDGGNMFLDR